jgi:hypothetical protein
MASFRRSRIPRRWQDRLSLWTPFLAGSVGAIAIIASLRNSGLPGEKLVALSLAWPIGALLGSRSRPILRHLRGLPFLGVNRTWDEALYAGILFFFGASAFLVDTSHFAQAGVALGVAINFSYASMKLRCWLMRCCECRRQSTLVAWIHRIGLSEQIAEVIASCVVGVAAMLSEVASTSMLLAYIGHCFVRYFDRYIRFRSKSLESIMDWETSGILATCIVLVALTK